jgi:hypothetical protein
MSLKSPNAPSNAQDPFTALRAQADQERLRARRGGGQKNDLLGPQENSNTGLYSDEMIVDTPQQNNKGNQNQNRRRGRR